jgi:hypothetical protein
VGCAIRKMIIYKVLYKNYKLRKGELMGILVKRRKNLRGQSLFESGLKWARSMFGQMVGDKQAIFVIPLEVTLRDNSVVPVEKMVFPGEEFFGTMRG